MSQAEWIVAAIIPGVERQLLKRLDVDEAALLKLLHRWRKEAGQVGRQIKRIVVALRAQPVTQNDVSEKGRRGWRDIFST